MSTKTEVQNGQDAFQDWCIFQGHIDLLKAIFDVYPEAEDLAPEMANSLAPGTQVDLSDSYLGFEEHRGAA